MSLTDAISGHLQAMAAGVARAQQETAAVDHAVEQIAARAAASGFAGIAVALIRVREVVGQVRARLTAVSGVLGEASHSVAAAPQQPSPQEAITVLTPVVVALTAVDAGVAAAASGVEEGRRLVTAALRGGQPGPTLSRLQQVSQSLAEVRARGVEARQHVDVALAEAAKVGDLGN